MDGRSGPGWVRALGFLVVVLLIGGIGYMLGVGAGTAGVVATAPPAGTVVYAPWGHGFGFFGFLFPLLIILLLFAAFSGGRRRGGYGHGYGPGWYGRPGEHRDVPPPYDKMLESWHQRAHGESETDSRQDQRPGPAT